MPDVITSFANPTVKRYRGLAARKNRRKERAFTVEGLQPVWFAVESAWQIDTLIVAPDLLTHEPTWQMVDEASRGNTPVMWVSRDVFAHLSDRDGPSGLAAIVAGTIGGAGTFKPAGIGPVVALHHVGNPGNIGTILRSADAAGAAGLLLVGPCADPLAPQSVKASMGSLFAVPIAEIADEAALFEWADTEDRPVVAVSGNSDASWWGADIASGSVLLFGSEREGLPAAIAGQAAQTLSIPMQGTAESLNLATAASVTLFDMARRRSAGEPA